MTKRPVLSDAVERPPGDDDLIVVPTCCGLCVVIDRREFEEDARASATGAARQSGGERALSLAGALGWMARQFAAVRPAS